MRVRVDSNRRPISTASPSAPSAPNTSASVPPVSTSSSSVPFVSVSSASAVTPAPSTNTAASASTFVREVSKHPSFPPPLSSPPVAPSTPTPPTSSCVGASSSAHHAYQAKCVPVDGAHVASASSLPAQQTTDGVKRSLALDTTLADVAVAGDAATASTSPLSLAASGLVSSSTVSSSTVSSSTVSSVSAVAKATASTPKGDDERASDSGSSAATEADNSEDEHSDLAKERSEIPVRTLREREREFSDMLSEKGLRIVEMRPDGNCLFRALAHVIWNDNERHLVLRSRIMQYLVEERDYFSQFVAEDFARYVRRKSRDGTHGNHLELQAAAELFGRSIEVYSYGNTPATIVDSWAAAGSASECAAEPIRLSFHRGCHYNAVVPVQALMAKSHGKFAAVQHAPGTNANTATAAPAASVGGVVADGVDEDWRVAAAAIAADEDEVERAVIALSLVEATRGDAAAGSSSSSSSMIPSDVLALVNLGYSEEQANEAYRMMGHSGLAEMVRYLTAMFPRRSPVCSSFSHEARRPARMGSSARPDSNASPDSSASPPSFRRPTRTGSVSAKPSAGSSGIASRKEGNHTSEE